jgi:hypothetical protein
MEVQVLFADRDGLGGRRFDQVAIVNAPDHYDTQRALEYAFRRTQNIEGSWSMSETIQFDGDTIPNFDYDPNVIVVKPLSKYEDGVERGHRSAMMYDRMIVDGEIYEVDAFGFRKLEVA